jgi:multiple sugar transport system ATP-binding protein
MSDTEQRTEAPVEETVPGTDDEEDINVRIDSLRKVFQDDEEGEVVAVDGISIDVRRGEFLVLVGPSGCGKTTTLRSVAGLETPTDGRIIIEGEDVTGLDPRERDISMVFQNYALYPHKKVRGNLSFPLEVRSFPKDEIDRRVEHTAGLLDIPELLDRKPGQLSGGQQQRVALGRAIVREPSVFLMDEPLSNLDAKLRVQMRTELNELHRRVGKTTIYVTHDQAEAMTLGDRVAVMNDGKLQQIGPPQFLYENPKNRFVAGFIGEPPMNFFDVDLVESDGGYRVQNEFLNLRLAENNSRKIDQWEGSLDSVTFGIRPEDLDDASLQEDYDRENTFEAFVKVIEPLGSEIIVTLTRPDGDMDSEEEFTAAFDPESDITEGDVITIAPDMDRTHVFDDASGENVTY